MAKLRKIFELAKKIFIRGPIKKHLKVAKDVVTIAEKELKLSMRFKMGFFLDHLVSPIIRIIPFVMIYSGIFFMLGGSGTIGGEVSTANFILFLLIGMVVDVYFSVGVTSFQSKFINEKYWQTIEATFLAPINKLSLIFGVGVSEAFAILPMYIIFGIVSLSLMPIGIERILVAVLVLGLIFTISLSLGLIFGSISLFQENLSPIAGYFRMGITFFACFYYPITVLPVITEFNILQSIARLNPIFQGVDIIRSVWFGNGLPPTEIVLGFIPINPLIYLVVVAAISPLIAVFVFDKMWKMLGIQGY